MAESDKRRILVVDDEASNINALHRILIPTYEVIVAKNGESAILKAQKHVPDLILLDVVMPDISGFDVIVYLKELETTRNIPIIFITGLDSSEDEERGLTLGAVDYIIKPFHDSIVKARVGTHLQIVEYISIIERLCRVDALTNIANRRCFDSQVKIEWERAARDKRPVSLLMIDIDHFKRYNDNYGHPQGDMLLKTVAAIFEQSMNRPADFVARWGGEEFAALLPDTDSDGAIEVAERIRTNVERAVVPTAAGEMTKVTVSVGINTGRPVYTDSVDDFISGADQALYSAKHSGRNRVTLFSDAIIQSK